MQWFTRPKTKVQTFETLTDAKEKEDWAIIGLSNEGVGVPTSIMVKGSVKCMVCEGFTTDRLICMECTEAVTFLRAADNLQAFTKLLEFASRPGMLTVLKLLTDDAVADLLMKRIDDARNRS